MKCDSYNSYKTTFEKNKGKLIEQKKQNTDLKQKILTSNFIQGTLKIVHIEENEQQTVIMTKALSKLKFEYLRKHIMR